MTREETITTLKEMHDTFDEIHENTNGDIGYEQMTALEMAIEALSAPQTDYISRADAIEALSRSSVYAWSTEQDLVAHSWAIRILQSLPSADAEHGAWIPCGEKMPNELERVNVTWLNHNPPSYYQHIKDIPQTDTAVYYRGKWYWWDVTVIDFLAEYGEYCSAEPIDKGIEVVAWMPLPTPYNTISTTEGR